MVETPRRSFVKALTWQAMGLVVMTTITWAVTGSVGTGGAIALLGAATGMVTYILHERAWARVRWGQVSEHREQGTRERWDLGTSGTARKQRRA